MAYELKDGSGSLFKNNRKEQDSHPDYTGKIMIGGQLYYLSAWVNETSNGQKYFGMKVKPAEYPVATEGTPQTDDQLPF